MKRLNTENWHEAHDCQFILHVSYIQGYTLSKEYLMVSFLVKNFDAFYSYFHFLRFIHSFVMVIFGWISMILDISACLDENEQWVVIYEHSDTVKPSQKSGNIFRLWHGLHFWNGEKVHRHFKCLEKEKVHTYILFDTHLYVGGKQVNESLFVKIEKLANSQLFGYEITEICKGLLVLIHLMKKNENSVSNL